MPGEERAVRFTTPAFGLPLFLRGGARHLGGYCLGQMGFDTASFAG